VVRAPARLVDNWTAGDDPAVQVVDSAELRASGARTLQEALERLPGVHLSDEQGNRFQADLTARGLTASPVTGLPQGLSVFLDGVRVNEPAVEEVNFDLIPLADVERVVVIRGPHAVFGRNTIGGAIHVLTRRGGPAAESEVELEAGSTGSQEVRARASGPLGPLDGYLSLSEATDRGWRDEGGARSLRALGKVGLRRDETDAAISWQAQVDRLQQPGSLPLPLLLSDPSRNYTPGDFFRPALHLVVLNARQVLTPGLSLAANAFLRSLDAEQFNSSRVSPDTRLLDRTLSWGGTLQVDHRARLGWLRNRLSAGAEASRAEVRISVHQEPNASFGSIDGAGLPLPRLSSDLADAQRALGLFLQDQVAAAEGPGAGLALTAALRFDRVEHSIVDTSPDDPGKATGRMAFQRLVPAAGLSWAFAPRWSASASFTGGFRAPAFLELTCADPAAPCIGLQAGVAPDTSLAPLRPVRSRTLEAGLSGSPLEGASATLSLFRTDLSDDIFALAAPGTTRVVFQNVGSTRRQGLEVALRWRRGPLEADAAYSHTRATFESDLTLATPRTATGTESVRRGAEIPLVPRHRLDLGSRVRPREWLRLSAGMSYVGSQVFRGDEANEAPRLRASLLLRAGAEVSAGAFTAALRVENLLDARSETFGTFAPYGRNPAEIFLTPGPPRRFSLALRWEPE
jgi:outer membrane receptor protein involved in Fe transport